MLSSETVKSIEELHRLKTEGIITDDEFEKSKQKLLFGPSKSSPVSKSALALPEKSDHVGWMVMALRRYTDFEGRSTRKEFWMFQLAYIALAVFCMIVYITAGTDEYGDMSATGRVTVMSLVLSLLVLFLPLLAVEVRRFHDQDKSGWFALINLVPYVGSFIVFALMMVEGTRGENSYGPDPREQ